MVDNLLAMVRLQVLESMVRMTSMAVGSRTMVSLVTEAVVSKRTRVGVLVEGVVSSSPLVALGSFGDMLERIFVVYRTVGVEIEKNILFRSL